MFSGASAKEGALCIDAHERLHEYKPDRDVSEDLKIVVMDWDRFGDDEVVGEITFRGWWAGGLYKHMHIWRIMQPCHGPVRRAVSTGDMAAGDLLIRMGFGRWGLTQRLGRFNNATLGVFNTPRVGAYFRWVYLGRALRPLTFL